MTFIRMLAIGIIVLFLAACGGAPAVPSTDENTPVVTQQTSSLPSVGEDVEVVSFSNSNVGSGGHQPPAWSTAPAIQLAGLGEGASRAIARSTDIAMIPELEEPLTFDESPVPITFSEFYTGFETRVGLILSDKLKSLDGEMVVIEGYVAPPLKPRLDFFVLTRMQLAFCPFCSSDVEWPTNIALVYLPEVQNISSEFPVRITGQMQVGSSTDAETGMVSMVRIYAETIEPIR